MKKILFVLGLMLAFVFGAVYESNFDSSDAFVIVKNESDECLRQLKIQVKDTDFKLAGLPHGRMSGTSFKIKSDSHYDVSVVLDNGKQMKLSAGYMTNGLESYDLFVIVHDSIEHHSIPPFSINSSLMSD